MKIAFISPFIYRLKRGIERVIVELSNELAKNNRDVNVTILTWQEKSPLNIGNIHERVKIFKVPYFRYFQSKAAIPFYSFNLLKNYYDIVNIFFAGYGEMAALMIASLIKSQRFNVIFHYPYRQVPYRYKEFQKCGFIDKADNIISVSAFVADGVKECYGKESVIIYNGFNEKLFSPNPAARSRIRKELGLSEENKVILTIAALEERKGIHKIIDIMPSLRRKVPQVRYIVLGEGPYEQELKQRIQQLGVEENVLLLGVKNDPVPYYCAADLFALLSYGEAFPLVILEAMGSGLPVVVSRQRPFDEIANQSCMIVVNENDPREILYSLSRVLSDRNQQKRLGAEMKEFAVRNYSWKKIAGRYYEVFRKQLAPEWR